jgi:TP901 family phage tail tape measure protein
LVEDQFKIGINLQLEQSSLADLQKQIEKAVKEATKRAMKSVDLGAAGPSRGAVAGAASAVGVKGSDFPKAVQKVMKGEFKSFEQAAKQITASMDRLTDALNKQQRASKAAPRVAAPPAAAAPAVAPRGRNRTEERQRAISAVSQKAEAARRKGTTEGLLEYQKQLAKLTRIITQEQRLQERSRSIASRKQAAEEKLIRSMEKEAAAREAAARRVAAQSRTPAGGAVVSGPPDPREKIKNQPVVGGTAQNIKSQRVARSRFAREQPAGDLVTPPKKPHMTGDPKTDSPGRKQAAAKATAAKETPPRGGIRDYQKQAQEDAKAIANTLTKFAETIESKIPLFKGKDLRSEFGLPSASDVRAAKGGVATVTSTTGRETIAGSVVKIANDTVTRIDRISNNLQGVEQELAAIAKAGIRRPELAKTMLRQMVRKRVFEDAQPYEKHQAMGQFIRGGEAQMMFEPSQSQAKKIMSHGRDQAGQIAEVEAILHNMAKSSDKFAKAGLDVVSILGLTEMAAAGLSVALAEVDGKFSGMVEGKVQTRAMQQIHPGGPGFGKQARSLYLKGAAKITGGEEPEIQSNLEKVAYAEGLFSKAAKNLVTAAVSFKQIPEVLEDQILIAASAAKEMGMYKSKSSALLKDPAEDLVAGMGLEEGQVLGIDAAGKEVKMSLEGTAATITSLEEVHRNGIRMFKVVYDEFNEMVTGAKVSTRPGHKGIAKVVPDEYLTGKLGLPKGTKAAASIEGFMKRGDLQDLVAMISTSMSDGGKYAAQEIYDKITDAMKAGSEMYEAVQMTAQEMGLDPNAAMQSTSGALAAGGIGKALTGRLSWFRMEKEGQTGAARENERYLDPIATKALQQRSETLSFAMAAQERSHQLVSKKQKDYHNALLSMTGASKEVTAGLQKMKPEDFSMLPSGMLEPDLLKGTLADEEFMKKAFSLQVPKFEGGYEDFYVPGVGGAVGQRGGYTTEEGLSASNDLTKVLEKFRQQALQIKGARGEMEPRANREAQMESAEYISRLMNQQIEAIEGQRKGGKLTSEGKALAEQFKAAFMPLVQSMDKMNLKSGIQWLKRTSTGRETVETFRGKPGKYVEGAKGNLYQETLRIRDLLGIRSGGGVSKARGKAKAAGVLETESIGSAGALFDNLELLEQAMDRVGKTAGEDANYMAKLWKRLEQLREQILLTLTEQGFGKTGRPAREELRRVAQTRDAGISPAPYAKAVEFAVDIGSELEYVEDKLKGMAAAGKDVGGSLEAFERIKSLQVSDDALPKDAVLLSKQDYSNMIRMTKRVASQRGETIDTDEAKRRMGRGVLHRYPTTGGGSFQIVKMLEDKLGRLPEGQVGISGSFATSSVKDLQKMRAPLEEFRESLLRTVRANKGQGAEADVARAQLRELNQVLAGLTLSFEKAMMNLDFDGDSITAHAALTKDSADEMLTVQEIMAQGGTSLQAAMRSLLGNLEGGEDLDFESLKGINEAFGKVVKRPDALKRAVPMPLDESTARLEASALVGGKLSVGILSDAFNILHTAIMGGAKETGDAFATAMDYIMLNINKSLAAKHGTGDLAGPQAFISELKTGPQGLKNIFKGMEKGGQFAEIGDLNQKYRKEIENQLMTQSPAQLLAEAIKQGILKEGDEVDASNFDSVIATLVDRMDLRSQIATMWDMLAANMREALASKGMGAKQVEFAMKKMTTMDPESGKIPGLDLDQLVPKAYGMTRKRGSDRMRKASATEQGKAILEASFSDLQREIQELELDPSGPLKAGSLLSSELEAWISSIEDMYISVDKELIRGMGLDPKKVGGFYDPGPPGTSPGEGTVGVSEESRVKPLMAALEALKRIESGDLKATPSLINFVIKAIKRMGSTLVHENIHKGSKVFRSGVENMSRALMESTGPIGAVRSQIMEMADTFGNVKKARGKFEQLRRMQWEQGKDATVGQVPGLEKYEGMDVGTATAKQGQKYFELVAEEMMAHLADPEKWKRVFGGLPEEVGTAIIRELARLEEAMPDLTGPVRESVSGLLNKIGSAFAAALRGEEMPDVRQVRIEAEERAGAAAGMPSLGKFRQMRESLGMYEQALGEGRTARRLAPGQKVEGRMKTAREVSFAFEGTFEDSVSRMKDVLKEMAASVDPDRMGNLKTEYLAAAKSYREGIRSMGGDEGREASKAYREAMQEFQAHEAQMLINKTRDVQDSIDAMRKAGETEGSDFDSKIQEFDKLLTQLFTVFSQVNLPGTWGVSGIAADQGGNMLEGARALGVTPGPGQYKDVIGRAAGPDDLSKSRFGNMSDVLEGVKDDVKEGMDYTVAWARIWDELVSQPEHMVENLGKVHSALKDMSKLMLFERGPEQSTQALDELSKSAKTAHGILSDKEPISTMEELNNELARSTKLKGLALTGKGLPEAYQMQLDQIKSEAVSWAKELNNILAQGVEVEGRHMKLGTRDIIDPKTGVVLKKFEVGAKRVGKQFEVSMNQANRSVNDLSGSMRNAMRRVVQWGFATGVIYGTIRAFRNMVTVVTEVETKVTALKKVMDTSITNFERMQDSASDFAQEFGVAIEDVLDGMVVYGQQGLKVNKIMERTRATMLAVNVTTLSSTDATEALTAAHKVFGESVSDSTEFVDAWANVAAKHAITAADLADAVKRSGAAAKVAGVGFEDFMGVVTAIGSVTRQSGKEVATSTKFMFRAMRRPTAQKELGKMGVQSLTPGGDFRSSMDILKDVAGSWDDMTRAQQVNMAQAMAGIRHYNSFIVLMNNFDEALLASSDAANSQGFAMRKNRLTMQTFSKNVNVLKESLKGLALEIGKSALGPATGFIQVISGITKAVGDLPPFVLQAGVAAAGMGLAFHKAADLVSDSMDAMSSGRVDLGEGAKPSEMLTGLGGGFRSVVEGLRLAGGGRAADETVKGLSSIGRAAYRARTVVDLLGTGILNIGRSAGNAVRGLLGMQKAATAFSAAMVTTAGGAAILAIAAALGFAYHKYREATKSAKEYEQSMEEVIGRSEDAASTLRSQSTDADRLSLAYAKIGKAQKMLGDDDSLAAAVEEGRFKGAATAAQTYSNMLADMSNRMAKLDPSKVRGITESGDYIVSIESNFKSLTQSALDSQNAITMALKTDVIAKFADELSKPIGIIDKMESALRKMAESVTGGDLDSDRSAMGKLRKTRSEIEKLSSVMEEQAAMGEYNVLHQERMNELVAQENEQRQSVLATANEIKRVFEAMPEFGDLGTAMSQVTPELRSSVGQAAEAGAFGRGSTLQSVMTQFMAKQAGLGGILDYQSTQGPGLVGNAFWERGIGAQSGAEAVLGTSKNPVAAKQIALLSQQAAEQLTGGAQVMFSAFDEATGEIVYQFLDEYGRLSTKAGSEIEKVVRNLESQEGVIADHFATFAKEEIQAAAEHTKKILTMQYTGVMAGVRIPTGGMPQLGPAREEELSVEQRVMRAMPKDMQRLADIQSEFNMLTKEYGEDILTDVEGTYKRQASSGKALKVVTQEVLQLATKLQQEGFFYSVLGNYQKMQEKLNMTLNEAAIAAEDYERAEANKNKFLKTSSGALAGKGPIPGLDLGKSFKELSGLEKLVVEVPGFERTLQGIQGTLDSRGRDLETLNQLEKQLAEFESAVVDMAEAGDNMTKEQKARYMEASGKRVGQGQLELMRTVQEESAETRKVADHQLDTQKSMLESLNELVTLTGMPEEERAAKYKEIMDKKSFKEITKAYGETFGLGDLNKLFTDVLNIGDAGGGQLKALGEVSGVETSLREDIAVLMSTVADWSKQQGSRGGQFAPQGRTVDLSEGGKYITNIEMAQSMLNKMIEGAITATEEGMSGFTSEVTKRTSPEATRKAAVEKENSEKQQLLALQQSVADKENETRKKYLDAIGSKTEDLEQANRELNVMKQIRMADAARNFATSLSDMVLEFQKADALVVTKLKSDIEGPFARVGQEGFRTPFENKRRELDKQYGDGSRPLSLSEMRERDKAYKDLDFEEKEAKTKQKQDVEVAALRQQQQQAERVRQTLADVAFDPNQDATLRDRARSYMDTLGEEMATSEQAEKRGRKGDLFFKGLPSLEALTGFAEEMKSLAAERAGEAKRAEAAQAVREGTSELNAVMSSSYTVQQEQLEELRRLNKQTVESKEGEGYISTPGGEILASVGSMADTPGIGRLPATGNTANNLESQRLARKSGNASAIPGAVVGTDKGVSGTQDTAAAREVARTGGTGGAGGAAVDQADAVSALSESIDALNEVISGLASQGITVSDDFSASIDGIGTAVSELADQTLTVVVENSPLDVTVSNIDELAAASSDAAAGAIGADITALGTRIESIEGLTAVDGTLNQSISTLQGEVSELQTTQDVAVSNLDTLAGEVSEFATSIDTAEQSALQASVSAEDARTAAEEAVEAATIAESTATLAATRVDDLATDLFDLENAVETNKQNIESQVRTIESNISVSEQDRLVEKRKLGVVEKLAQNADAKASQALSLAQARG